MIKRNENIVARKIHDTFFLIDVKQNYLNDKCTLYEINELGYFVWNAVSVTGDLYKIANMVGDEIEEDVEIDLIISDIETFFTILYEEGYVKIL